MKTKRLLALFLSIAVTCTFGACGNSNKDSAQKNSSQKSAESVSDTKDGNGSSSVKKSESSAEKDTNTTPGISTSRKCQGNSMGNSFYV